MIREDLIAERIAIDSYNEYQLSRDNDPTARRVMEEILAKEEEHARSSHPDSNRIRAGKEGRYRAGKPLRRVS